MDSDRDRFDSSHWKYAGVGFEMAGSVALFILIGYFVDQRWETAPKGVLIGALAGIVVGLYLVIKEAILMNRDEAKNDRCREKKDE